VEVKSNRWVSKFTRALIVVLIIVVVGEKRRSSFKQAGARDGSCYPSFGGRGVAVRQPTVQSAERSHTKRINVIAAATMLIFAGLLVAAVGVYWPNTSGPGPGRPTIGGAVFPVDKPNIDGGVRILINPETNALTGGPSGMVVSVDLDVPRGETVQWALAIDAVSDAISLTELKLPAPANSGYLIKAPRPYDLPSPINDVRDYLLVGKVNGPSSAYTQLVSSSSELPESNDDTSVTDISWSGPVPAVFQGAYATVAMPSLMSVPIYSTGEGGGGFTYSWKAFPLKRFHAVEELSLSADYQIDSGSQGSNGYAGWIWTSDATPGIVNASGIGSSLSITAVVDRDLVCMTTGRGRSSREGIMLAWHGTDIDRYTGKLARLP
jgi:hypothetical protein